MRMIRILLWLLGGVMLGGIIHIVVILTLPRLAEETVWARIETLEAANRVVVPPQVGAGESNPLGLDPALTYGICEVDLAQGPAYLTGRLPDAHWSLAIFDPSGIVTYATTNRDGIGQVLDLGIFNAAQTRLLARQQIDVSEGTLVVESDQDRLFVVVRLYPPQDVMRPRFEEALAAIRCGNQPVT
jgi:uncharacterized membrane protein